MVSSAFQPVVVVVLLTAAVAKGVPGFGGICLDSNDCGPSHCCLIGFGRYTSPTCTALGEVDSYCRENKADHFDLGYPNGVVLNVKRGYYGFCPCRPGLICCRGTAMCSLPESCHSKVFSDETKDV